MSRRHPHPTVVGPRGEPEVAHGGIVLEAAQAAVERVKMQGARS